LAPKTGRRGILYASTVYIYAGVASVKHPEFTNCDEERHARIYNDLDASSSEQEIYDFEPRKLASDATISIYERADSHCGTDRDVVYKLTGSREIVQRHYLAMFTGEKPIVLRSTVAIPRVYRRKQPAPRRSRTTVLSASFHWPVNRQYTVEISSAIKRRVAAYL
jgi:CRISPR/Cas system CSM-associated protein Csm3 (group 7 of RAMP superfamily)